MRNAMWVGGGITGMGEIPMLGVKEKGIAKVIRDIFRNGEKGFFYDPSDMGTLFQDAGLTPVTSAMQPVGVVLDKSKGLSQGLEVFNTIDLSDRGGWSTSGLVIDRTSNQFTTSGIGGLAYRIDSGKSYKIIMKGHSTAPFRVRSTSSTPSGIDTIPAGDFDIVMYPVSMFLINNYFFLQLQAAGVFTLEHLSLKELKGNHAYQSTSAARPIVRNPFILGHELAPALTADNWIKNGGWVLDTNGNASVDSSGVTSADYIQVWRSGLSGQKTYLVEIEYANRISGGLDISLWIGATPSRIQPTQSSGKASVVIYATTTPTQIKISNVGITKLLVKKVSLKEVTGYVTDQYIVNYDGIDDKLVTNLPTELKACTVLRAIPNVGTEVKYNQTLPMLYEDSSNHSGLIAIDRVLTRSEQLRLMTELDKKAGATSLETLTFKLFDNNQQGFVYDPNDLSTMFQSATALVPVTAVGQPVGLILDKRKGSATGVNLHTTATPINATTYTATSTRSGLDITVSKEEAGYGAVSLGIPTTVGKTYLLELTTPSTSGFWVLVSDGKEGDSVNRKVAAQNGTAVNTKLALAFTATAAISYVHLNRGSAITPPATFKNVSVREVLGNMATQPTSSSRPILRKNAVTGANYLEFDGIDDCLQISLGAVRSPFSQIHALETTKLSNTTQPILAGGAAGYFYTATPNKFGVQSTGIQHLLERKTKDTLTHIVENGSVYVGSSLQSGSSTEVSFIEPYSSTAIKYIAAFSATGTTYMGSNYYGGVFINKAISIEKEEAAIREIFNKRIGV